MYLQQQEAKQIAIKKLKQTSSTLDFEPVIMDEHTIEKEYAFIFSYESSRYLETGDVNDMLAGNAPIFVERSTGNILPTGTAYPIDYFLDNYEKFGTTYPLDSPRRA